MKRYVSGLNQASAGANDGLIDGLFLVRIERIQYRWHRQKPLYSIQFSVLEPIPVTGIRFAARLSRSSKPRWLTRLILVANCLKWPESFDLS